MDTLSALQCCPDNAYREIQLSSHGYMGNSAWFYRDQIENIRRSKRKGEPLDPHLQDIDKMLSEARRASPCLDVYACNVFRGDEGEAFRRLIRDEYGFEDVRGSKGTCGDVFGLEVRLPWNWGKNPNNDPKKQPGFRPRRICVRWEEVWHGNTGSRRCVQWEWVDPVLDP